MSDVTYMKQALALAIKGKGKTSPNPMVGSLILKGNKIIAQGWHRKCGGDHAEIIALKKAGIQAKGATLYVTLEPCFHHGKTPPCVDAIIKSGIKEVVVAMKDPNSLTQGKSLAKLRREGIKTSVGVLRKEAKQLNEVFIKYITTGMPFVVGKCAQSLDGKIATITGDSKWITSEETRAYARKIRDEFDAILVGINTVLKDDPSLRGEKKELIKIILDSTLKISLKAKVLDSKCIVATTDQSSLAKIKKLKTLGVQVLVCPSKAGKVHLKWLFKRFAKQEMCSILVEGGAHVLGSALQEKLIDKMHIYMAPKIVGDQDALSSVVGRNIKKINQSIQLHDLDMKKIGEDILIEGYI